MRGAWGFSIGYGLACLIDTSGKCALGIGVFGLVYYSFHILCPSARVSWFVWFFSPLCWLAQGAPHGILEFLVI